MLANGQAALQIWSAQAAAQSDLLRWLRLGWRAPTVGCHAPL